MSYQDPDERENTGAAAYGSSPAAKFKVGYSVASVQEGLGTVVEIAEDGPSYKYLVQFPSGRKFWIAQARIS